MSIQPDELQRMMDLIGAKDTSAPLRGYAKALHVLYQHRPTMTPEQAAKKLGERAQAAVEALAPWVIRHGVDDLPLERASFGEREHWDLPVREASTEELELMLRMDRALRCVRNEREATRLRTSDPRYHVG